MTPTLPRADSAVGRLCLVAWFIVKVLLGGLEAGPRRPVLSCRLTNMFHFIYFLRRGA